MAVTWPWAFLTLEMAQQCRCIAMKTRGSRHDICHGYYVTPMMTCRCTTKARRMDALPWDTVTGLPFHVLGQVTAAVLVSWQWLLYHHTSHTPGHCPFGQYVNMKHLRYIILVRIHYQSMWLETFRIVVAFATWQCAAWASTLITHKHSPRELWHRPWATMSICYSMPGRKEVLKHSPLSTIYYSKFLSAPQKGEPDVLV